jgi:PKD repeat protein
MTDQEPGSDYRIIVTSLTNEFPTDTSDNYFTIAEVTAIVPNFSASALDIAVGDSVMFSDNTTGSPTSWEWLFEGGTPSSYSGANPPYVTYSASGSFDVSLEVSDGVTTYVELKEDYIFVGEPPYADFTASETTILVGQTVDFTSNSTGDNLTYSWYFEGGTPETSTEENPMGILYSGVGFFDVELSVTNDYGESIMLREDYIEATGVGVIGLNDQTLSIWPNPAKDKIKISLPDDGVYTVKIIDLKGSSKIETVINNQFSEIDVSTLNSGLYLITVTDQNTFNTVSKKVLIN